MVILRLYYYYCNNLTSTSPSFLFHTTNLFLLLTYFEYSSPISKANPLIIATNFVRLFCHNSFMRYFLWLCYSLNGERATPGAYFTQVAHFKCTFASYFFLPQLMRQVKLSVFVRKQKEMNFSSRIWKEVFLGAAQTLLNQTVPVHLADGGDCCKLCLCHCCCCCRCNFSLLPQQLCRNITQRRWRRRRRQPKPAAISWQQIRRAQCIRCRRWAGNLTVAACHPFCLLPLLLLLP